MRSGPFKGPYIGELLKKDNQKDQLKKLQNENFQKKILLRFSKKLGLDAWDPSWDLKIRIPREKLYI